MDLSSLPKHQQILVNLMYSVVKIKFEDEGSLYPFMVIENSATRTNDILVPEKFADNADKDAFSAICRRKIAEINADISLLVCESWVVNRDKTSDLKGAVSEQPDKREAIIFQICTPSTQIVGEAPIIRSPKNTLGPAEWTTSPAISGRFSHLVPNQLN